jgi:phage terminase small subunit
MAKLTPKQRVFVQEYLIDLNATQAAIRAGYSPRTANVIASENIAKPYIKNEIDKVMAERSKRTGINADRVLMELARIGFANAADFIDMDNANLLQGASRDDTAVIASVKVKLIPTANGNGVEREIRLADKIKALERLGDHLNMWAGDGGINADTMERLDGVLAKLGGNL